MAIVIPAQGEILGRVLDSSHSISSEGLSRHAYRQFDAAQLRTAWGRHHQRRFALMEGDDLLASAVQYELAAVLDQQAVRVCGIGSIFSEPAYGDGEHAQLPVLPGLRGIVKPDDVASVLSNSFTFAATSNF